MSEKTKVVFRKHSDGDIVALFPELSEGGAMCVSYAHVGQHGAADFKYVVSKTRPAKPAEYADLLAELKSRGYDNLQVLHGCVTRTKGSRPRPVKPVGDAALRPYRRYYTVDIPEDAVSSDEEALDLAVLHIKDKVRLIGIPAEWRLVWRRGDLVRVCYTINRRSKNG